MQCTMKEIRDRVKGLNVQLDNLCQVLAGLVMHALQAITCPSPHMEGLRPSDSGLSYPDISLDMLSLLEQAH